MDSVKIKFLFAAISVHVSIEFVIKRLFLILTVDMMLGDKHTHTKTTVLLWVFSKTGAVEYFLHGSGLLN